MVIATCADVLFAGNRPGHRRINGTLARRGNDDEKIDGA
jgi:hypothetical protein